MVDFLFHKIERKDPRIKELFLLRYQVYCTECQFESPDDHPSGMESDEYDEHSVHFCAVIKETDEIIGTVRIILPSERGFPIEYHCDLNSDRPSVNRNCVGEISRLAISKDYRRRAVDQALYSEQEVDIKELRRIHEQRRQFESRIVAGLYQCVYHESLARGLTHWYAVMVKGLYCLLRRWGITWTPIGPAVEYHGLRSPYLAIIAENERQAVRLNPRLMEKPPGWID
ncbi:MAG: PEP-CTERM/exosortase system-associated acyltransferase [Desulfuromonadaceae bacterium]